MSRHLSVSAIQFERALGQKERNTERACALVREASERGAEIVALPELCSTGYFPRGGHTDEEYFQWAETIPGPITDRYSELARTLRITLIVPIFEWAPDRQQYYNSAAVITPTGVLGTYRKRHIPSLRPPNMLEKHYFATGDLGYPVFDVGQVRIGVSICYDRHFPETFRLLAYHGAELIVSVNNTGSDRSRHLWNPEAQTTASSNGVFLLQANAVREEAGFFGLSLLCNPFGQIVQQLPDDKEGVLIAEIDLDEIAQARTHYGAIHDAHWEDFGLRES